MRSEEVKKAVFGTLVGPSAVDQLRARNVELEKRCQPLVDHARADEFKALCDPLIKWLNDNFHPHVSVIVTPTSAELSSGETAYTTEAFLRD